MEVFIPNHHELSPEADGGLKLLGAIKLAMAELSWCVTFTSTVRKWTRRGAADRSLIIADANPSARVRCR